MAFYGRHTIAGDTDYGMAAPNQQRATVYERFPTNAWVYRLGFWGGKVTGGATPSVRVALWDTANLNPNMLLAETAAMSIGTAQSYGRDGQAYQSNVINKTSQPQTNAVMVWGGSNYSIGIVPTGASVGFAMVQAANITASNERLYSRSGVWSPTNPNGYTSNSNEGWITAWAEYTANRSPSTTAASPSGLITYTNPTFTGVFEDADKQYGDRISRVRIQVVRVSDNHIMWDSGALAATGAEQSSHTFSRGYAGTALAAGTAYRWRAQVADAFGTWSAWTAYTNFSINAGGYIMGQTTPTGRQTTQQPTPFTAVWRHANNLATNAIQVRILQGDHVLRTGSEVSKTVAVTGAASLTWAESFGTYSLTWGVKNLSWQMRGRDTGNLWSEWSDKRTFFTNSAPAVPASLIPTNSSAFGSYPLIQCTVTEPDGDTLTVKARIKNNAGTVLQTRTMARVGTSSTYQYQTTSADLPSYGIYKWDAYSSDGNLFSGATTVEANAAKSSEAVFIYDLVPVVTLTSPTPNQVFNGAVIIDWNDVPNTKEIKTTFYNEDGSVLFTRGWTTSSLKPLNFSAPGWPLRNNQTYSVVHEVKNQSNLVGTSDQITFSISYPQPEAPTGFIASPETLRMDRTPSAIRLTWDESTHSRFASYSIYRRRTGEELRDAMLLAVITSPQQTSYIDYYPESDTDFTYSIELNVIQGLDTLTSPVVETQATISLEYITLQNVASIDQRAILKLDTERGFQHHDDLVLEMPWGASAPIGIYGNTRYQSFSGTFSIANDEGTSARELISNLRTLWNSRATLCYRDERGRKFFAKITKFSETDQRVQFYTVNLDLTEVTFIEGV